MHCLHRVRDHFGNFIFAWPYNLHYIGIETNGRETVALEMYYM